MKINFGKSINFSDPRDVAEFLLLLEQSFDKIKLNDQIIIGGGTPIRRYLSASKTWDAPNVANGTETTTTVTVTGAALGDIALCSLDKSLQGMKLTAFVSATNTVTCVLRNDTGGPLDLASGTLRASVLQH